MSQEICRQYQQRYDRSRQEKATRADAAQRQQSRDNRGARATHAERVAELREFQRDQPPAAAFKATFASGKGHAPDENKSGRPTRLHA
jgi:hypothetical protein